MLEEAVFLENIVQFAKDEWKKGEREEAISLLRDALLWPQTQDMVKELLKKWGVEYLDSFMGGHSEDIVKLVVNSTGTLLYSLSIKGIIKVWDATTLNELKTLHLPNVGGFALSPDGQYLAVIIDYINIDIYETVDFKHVGRLVVGHVDDEESYDTFPVIYHVSSISFHPDNRLIAFGIGSDFVKIIGFPDGNVLKSIPVNSTTIINVAFSPDGNYLAYNDGTSLKVIKASDDWPLVSELQSKSYSFLDFIWNKLSNRLYTLSHKTLYRYNFRKKNIDKSYALLMDSPRSLAIHPDNRRLAVIDSHGIRLFRTWKFAEVGFYTGRNFTFHPVEKQAYLSEEEGVISAVDLNDNKTLAMSIKHHTISCVQISLPGNSAAVGLGDRVVFWDFSLKKRLRTYSLNQYGNVTCLSLSPSGDSICMATRYGYKVVDMQTLEEKKSAEVITVDMEGNTNGVAAFSGCGGKMVFGSYNRIVFYSLPAYKVEVKLECRDGWVTGIGFFGGSGKIYSIINNQYTLIWDLETGKVVKNLYGIVINISENGKFYWMLSRPQQSIELRSTNDHSELKTVPFPLKPALLVSNHDGSFLACAIDNSIKLWDVNAACECETVFGHSGNVNSIAFSHDSRYLISSSHYEAMITDLDVYRTMIGQ
ncbi:MAG: WD40 repeat domain-containing protein [Spirochaetales bacterium]|nr:WD40 repeat domain-containing protein [Spirochaetales bacterium]